MPAAHEGEHWHIAGVCACVRVHVRDDAVCASLVGHVRWARALCTRLRNARVRSAPMRAAFALCAVLVNAARACTALVGACVR